MPKSKDFWKSAKCPINATVYGRVHHWLRNNHGKANYCEGKECSGKIKKYEWAKKNDKEYECVRDNFMQLCISCHRKYEVTDEERKRRSERMKNKSGVKAIAYGHRPTEETKRKISESKTGKKRPDVAARNKILKTKHPNSLPVSK